MDIGTLYTSTDLIAYAFTFLLAATPWLEIPVVIPAGIAMGLNPSIVSFLAFTGNLQRFFFWFLPTNPCIISGKNSRKAAMVLKIPQLLLEEEKEPSGCGTAMDC